MTGIAGRPKAGRPTREQAEQRHRELLDHALEVFLDNGFERATVDAIAASTGMAKRTIYALYSDKAALFRAAVERAVDQWIVPLETLRQADNGDLEQTLAAVARIRLANDVTPVGLKLQRILAADSYRFPGLYRIAYERSTMSTVRFLVDLLQRYAALGAVVIDDDPEMLAFAFLALSVGGPMWGTLWGVELTPETIERRIEASVRLFLDGVKPR